eukprot:1141274-Pelagomonas_calceolata.AAC.1
MKELRNNLRTHLMQQKKVVSQRTPGSRVQKAHDTCGAKNKHVHQYKEKKKADTGISRAGPGGNPFSHLIWLAKEGKKEHNAGTSTAPTPNTKNTYLPSL